MFKDNPKNFYQKGVALYFAVLFTSLTLAIVLGLSTISILQMKVISDMGYSVGALYAADSGIEKVLYDENQGVDIQNECNPYCEQTDPVDYQVIYKRPGDPNCFSSPETHYCLESVGFYHDTRRAIRVTR